MARAQVSAARATPPHVHNVQQPLTSLHGSRWLLGVLTQGAARSARSAECIFVCLMLFRAFDCPNQSGERRRRSTSGAHHRAHTSSSRYLSGFPGSLHVRQSRQTCRWARTLRGYCAVRVTEACTFLYAGCAPAVAVWYIERGPACTQQHGEHVSPMRRCLPGGTRQNPLSTSAGHCMLWSEQVGQRLITG